VRELERRLGALVRQPCTVAIEDVAEVDADSAFAALVPPLAALRFDARGRPGWVLWNNTAALAMLELALGATTPTAQARELTSVERMLLVRVVSIVLGDCAKALGLSTSGLRSGATLEELGSWREAGSKADAGRIDVHVVLEGAAGRSTIRLLLPLDPSATPSAEARKTPERAPEHLADVTLELSARLGAADVPLTELLALEEGDVIPLGAPAAEGVTLWVEGHACASARLGNHSGKLAVRIDSTALERNDDPH
jgi:flagellar motor switch protein FliM